MKNTNIQKCCAIYPVMQLLLFAIIHWMQWVFMMKKKDLKINYELSKKQAKIKIMVELAQDKTFSISETAKKSKC